MRQARQAHLTIQPLPILQRLLQLATRGASSLVEQVSRRPSVLPAQVIAKLDTTATPTRLIAIDKTTLPANSSIALATGILTVPTGTAVSGIAGVTLNGAAFTNSGQYTLSGSTHLVINFNLISQPAAGVTHTYVVTMNNSSGGGTTLATVTVTHGSVGITSVVISSGIITPTLTGLALSSASVVYGAAAPTITVPTSASAGAITYSSSNTAVFTVSGSTITVVGVGTATLTATQAANGNYASTTQTTSLTVTAALPLGYITSGGLTWAPSTARAANWSAANSTCSASTALGSAAGTWRQPTRAQLAALYAAGTGPLASAGWTLGTTWSMEEAAAGYHYTVDLGSGVVDSFIDSFTFGRISCVR